ncbi:MAG: hypothetical protein IJW94_03195 [Oscillospiraceae bacterium]|nr:hypothetical protein [Oscillospiraceae bacterium]
MNLSNRVGRSCCFLGHREICETKELKIWLYEVIQRLIVDEEVDSFLFGSKSCFNSLCYELVSEIKVKYPQIKRIYVRAEFPIISVSYKEYLLEKYEDTYYPASLAGAGRAVYVKRNNEMINCSQFCVFYCIDEHIPKGRKSGTKQALEYARKHNKTIYRFPPSEGAKGSAGES